MNNILMNQIVELIKLKQEGSYWDFKKSWYTQDKNDDLLHDIICMANNLVSRDSYIIIGVDEEQDFSILDVEKDQNRKNTQKIVDFLKDKKFAGGTRPIVYVENIQIRKKKIDIIVVKNTFNTPYYLIERYMRVCQNNIYIRLMDTNTPKNSSADINNIEYLWKKRFRLLETDSPLDRLCYYLKDKCNWIDSPNEHRKYYKQFPEFVIETEKDERNGYVYYLFNQYDKSPNWYNIKIYYHQTLLEELGGIALDGGRYFTPSPRTNGISFKYNTHWDISFKYFTKDSIDYNLHTFFYNNNLSEEKYSHDRFLELILIFSSDREKIFFKNYVKENWDCSREKYNSEIFMPHFQNIEGYNMEVLKEDYKNAKILIKMLSDFRSQ